MLLMDRRAADRSGMGPRSEIVIVLPDGRTLSVWLISAKGYSARIGVDAPKDIGVYRRDLLEQGGTGGVAVPLLAGKK